MKIFIFFSILGLAAMALGDDKQLENLLYEGNNKFTARMFTEVAKENTGKSFVLSAYSVLTPLAQLSLASVAEAHDELLDTIGMPNDNTTKEVFSLVNTKVRALKGITLKTASKIYVAEKYELNSKFAEDTKNIFGSEVQSTNFLDSQKAASEVNAWVEEQTNHRIKDLVDPDSLTAATRALLVNAIYFKGIWKNQFQKSLTRDYTFNVNKDVTTQVRMMYRRGSYKYAESHELKSQIIEIPYEGDESSLVVVLPLDKQGSIEVQELLKDSNVLEKALENMYETEVELYLPQYKIETSTDLKEILIRMNIQRMFGASTAKLYNLLKDTGDLYIDSAKQKAFMEVNEEGAEATAANVFGVSYTSSLVYEPEAIKFICDHPFFFYLRGKQYTLFNGAYYSSEVAKINPDSSFVISPFSVMTPLVQLSIAAREKTRDQLWDAIGMRSDDNVKKAFSLINTRVNSVKDVTLKTVSKIYIALNYDVYKDFGAATWEAFGAAAQNIDFEKNEQAANEINTWVEQNTNNHIKNLVSPDSLDAETRALLVNAIYFKGSWETQFDKALTSEKDFHINNAETKKVDMMHRRGSYKYTESAVLKSQIIEIPYKGGETSLVVVLPLEIEGIKEVQEVLRDPTVLDNALNNLRKQEVDLYLPKFKIESTTDLKDILQKLNVTEIFDPSLARLDYLIRVKGNMYVSSAVQKAFIEVNEEGAEAAGSNVSEVVIESLTVGPKYHPVFNADRPFHFVLKMNSLPVFSGVMYAK